MWDAASPRVTFLRTESDTDTLRIQNHILTTIITTWVQTYLDSSIQFSG